MKAQSVILTLGLMFSVAFGVDVAVNYDAVNKIVYGLEAVADETVKILEDQLEKIVLTSLHEIDEAVEAIEEQRLENEPCVAVQDERLANTLDTLHSELSVCGVNASRTSAEIAIDVNRATKQLFYDGFVILTTYRRCRRYKYSAYRKSCYARLSIKATIYLLNAPKSIKTIKESRNERIPAVYTDADSCINVASDNALLELNEINATIDACARATLNQ